jgi:hypothetical protein
LIKTGAGNKVDWGPLDKDMMRWTFLPDSCPFERYSSIKSGNQGSHYEPVNEYKTLPALGRGVPPLAKDSQEAKEQDHSKHSQAEIDGEHAWQ